MNAMAKDLDDLIARAKALQTKAHVGKGDREEFVKIAEGLKCQVTNTMPFYQQQFTEATEHVVQEARAGFESFVQQTLRAVGVEALKTKLAETGMILQLPSGQALTKTVNES